MVNELECPSGLSADGLALYITWQPPSVNPGSVVLYELTVKEYKQFQGTQIATVDLSTPFREQVDVDGNLASVVTTAGIREYTN